MTAPFRALRDGPMDLEVKKTKDLRKNCVSPPCPKIVDADIYRQYQKPRTNDQREPVWGTKNRFYSKNIQQPLPYSLIEVAGGIDDVYF